MDRIRRALMMTFLLLALGLAGCMGGGDAGASADDEQLDRTTEDELGTIEGVALNSEGLPVAGVQLGLAPTTKETTSLSNGSYRFANVEPGEYTLVAQKLGFESQATKVAVEPGQTVRKDLILTELRVVESYHYTEPYTGVLTCSFTTPAWTSPCDYPYTAVYYTLQGLGVNGSNYGLPAEPLANEWRYFLTVQNGTTGIVSELAWEPVSAASEQMMLYVSCDEFDPVIDDCGAWGDLEAGPSPVIIYDWNFPKNEEDPTFMTRVYLPWGDPQVAVDQKFDVYHTMFYGADVPDDFTALPPQ